MRIFGFAGWSGSGKTTLIEQLIPRFVGHGLTVSLIKHAHHTFDVDHPGKDSYRHRNAGAAEILVTSSRRWVLMHELRGSHEPSFDEQVKRISPCDLLLVEGFKFAPIPKLEVWRQESFPGVSTSKLWCACLMSETRRPCFTKRGMSFSTSVVLPLPDQPAKPKIFIRRL